jgi:hypothetical protein
MQLKRKYNVRGYSPSEIFMILLASLSFFISIYIAIKYANQAPLELHEFRQTQTALTAYWLVKNGFSLAYETPVAGPPWSIPFEFPIYQYIVALASQIMGYSLNATGRIVSFIFLALCIIPAKSITKNLNISRSVFYIFTALLFSSPLYLYWGRTFMIETAALFFSIAAIKYFVDIIQAKNSFKNQLFFVVFITLSILQKITTGLPVLALLCLVYFFLVLKRTNSLKNTFFDKKAILGLIYFGIPLAIGIGWSLYTDQVKTLNGLGVSLTSSALSEWNWGTLRQRFSFYFYVDLIWRRVFEQNLSGALGVAILMNALFFNANNSIKSIVVISSLMGLAPLFLFTNLHIVHDYYQTANVIFLIYAVAVSLGHILNNYLGQFKTIVFALMVISNYSFFQKEYLDLIQKEFTKENSRDYAVSEILRREIPQGKYFVAFVNHWGSPLTYLAERKSFTVPPIFKQYDKISLNPEHFIEETHLGAVVLCSSAKAPTINDLIRWSSTNRNWKIGKTHGCYIAVSEVAPLKIPLVSQTECQDSVEFTGVIQAGTPNILSVTVRPAISVENGAALDEVYVTLTKKNGEPIYFETLQVDSGFSRIMNVNLLAGKYALGVTKLYKGHLESCQFQKEVSINDGNVNE